MSVTYRFDCTHCNQSVVQSAPAELIFALWPTDDGRGFESDQHSACSKCTKLIREHNEPLEAKIHIKTVKNKEAKREVQQTERRTIGGKPKPVKKEKVESLPSAEQAPDAMALLAGAIANLAKAQEATNEKLEKLINGKDQDTGVRPLESKGGRRNTAKSAGNKKR